MLLRCSVNGGLEELAQLQAVTTLSENNPQNYASQDDVKKNKVNNNAHTCSIRWTQRGNSGSQLQVECPSFTSNTNPMGQMSQQEDLHLLKCILTEWRFVEYVYLMIASSPISVSTIDNNSQSPGSGTSTTLLSSKNSVGGVVLQATTKSDNCIEGDDVIMKQIRKCTQSIFTPELLQNVLDVWYQTQTCLSNNGARDSCKFDGSSTSTTSTSDHDESPEDDTYGLMTGHLLGSILKMPEINMVNTSIRQPRQQLLLSNTVHKQETPNFSVNTIYTNPQVAKAVVDIFQTVVEQHLFPKKLVNNNDNRTIIWLDAGAGSGALLQHLPPCSRIGIDLNPSSSAQQQQQQQQQSSQEEETVPHKPLFANQIYRKDFLKVSTLWLQNQKLSTKKARDDDLLCVISNPPFAQDSRGDYSIIVKFINHAFQVLDASFVGVIVPTNFVRRRIWSSLKLTSIAKLLTRCQLPQNAFYDPSTSSIRNIPCTFLIFGRHPSPPNATAAETGSNSNNNHKSGSFTAIQKPKIQVIANRNKGDFPTIRTKELVNTIHSAISLSSSIVLGEHGFQGEGETCQRQSETTPSLTLLVEVKKIKQSKHDRKLAEGETKGQAAKGRQEVLLEFYILLNPKRPLSLANCVSCRIEQHSLGWLSNSVRPNIACAMWSLATATGSTLETLNRNKKDPHISQPSSSSTTLPNKNKGDKMMKDSNQHQCNPGTIRSSVVVVNPMCGEGTFELESHDQSFSSSGSHDFFMISGDQSEESVSNAKWRVKLLQQREKRASVVTSSGTLTTEPKQPWFPKGIEFVIWDAHHLPLREGIVDVMLLDLPFAGSKKRRHQVPSSSAVVVAASKEESTTQNQRQPADSNSDDNASSNRSVSYPEIMVQTIRSLSCPYGRAVLASADSKSLSFSALTYNGHYWNVLLRQNINLGGLAGKIFLMERRPSCFKDVSVQVYHSHNATQSLLSDDFQPQEQFSTPPEQLYFDLSSILESLAMEACDGYSVNDKLHLTFLEHEQHGQCKHHIQVVQQQQQPHHGRSSVASANRKNGPSTSLINCVKRHSTFQKDDIIRHCYRIYFDHKLSNAQTKRLEKQIRGHLQIHLPRIGNAELT